MKRVQAALGAQLARQNEKLEIEVREKVSTVISPTLLHTQHTDIHYIHSTHTYQARLTQKIKI